jgi:hypothetical protein
MKEDDLTEDDDIEEDDDLEEDDHMTPEERLAFEQAREREKRTWKLYFKQAVRWSGKTGYRDAQEKAEELSEYLTR